MSQEITVDARRLLCPLPVIRTQTAVDGVEPNTQVTVICTDPGALHDVPAWARVHGHEVIETRQEERDYIIVLKTKESD